VSTRIRRLERLEEQFTSKSCPMCRDWPALVVQMDDDEPDHPTQCSACGREVTQVIRLATHTDGP
jgi:hypothetical protein